MPGVYRQSLDDDARGGLWRFAPTLTPPRRIIICDAPVASLRAAARILEGPKSYRYFYFFVPNALAQERRHGASYKI